jgi:hypothetical protein
MSNNRTNEGSRQGSCGGVPVSGREVILLKQSRFSARRPMSRQQIESVPCDKPAVYRILDKNGENTYTGTAQRGRVADRLAEHLPGGKDPIRGGTSFQIKQARSIDEARRQEQRVISREKPKQNKQV